MEKVCQVTCDFNTIFTSHHFRDKHTAVCQRSCRKCCFTTILVIGVGLKITVEADFEGTFCCNKCKYTSSNETQYRYHLMLWEHKSKEGNQSKKTCNKCEFSTKDGWELTRHIFYKHGDGDDLVFSSDIDNQYTCEHCEYQSSMMSNIKRHYYNNHVKNSKSKQI